jgi:hypothetical protein
VKVTRDLVVTHFGAWAAATRLQRALGDAITTAGQLRALADAQNDAQGRLEMEWLGNGLERAREACAQVAEQHRAYFDEHKHEVGIIHDTDIFDPGDVPR